MINKSNPQYDFVVCSSPENDNQYGENFSNVVEADWDDLYVKIKDLQCLFVDNGDQDQLKRLITFLNTYNIDHSFVVDSEFYVSSPIEMELSENDILFIGCSHTEGDGHSSEETMYTTMTSSQLNLTPVVQGFSGKGNYLFEEQIFSYNDIKNKKMIIQFTDIYRIRQNGHNKPARKYNKFDTMVYTEEVLTSMFIEQVNRIVKYLRSNNVQFLFFHLSLPYPYFLTVNSILSKHKEFVYMEDYNRDVGDLGHHFGVKSHSYIANKLVKKWNMLYV